MKDFLKKYGLLIIPILSILYAIPGIIENTSFYNNRMGNLLLDLLAVLLMVLPVTLSIKAVSKPIKRSKYMLTNAMVFAFMSVIVKLSSNILVGYFNISPIEIIALICVIVNTIIQKKSIRQKKDTAPAMEVQEKNIPDPVEAKTEAVIVASDTTAVATEKNNGILKGKVLFNSVEDVSGAILTVTDEGFRYVGKAQQYGSFKKVQVDVFVEYSTISDFKVSLGFLNNITANGYTYAISVHKEDEEAINYIHDRYMERHLEEQNKQHIMRCNVCGQIYTYTLSDIDEQVKKMKSAAGAMGLAALTTIGSSMLRGDIQSGNAQNAANAAEDKLNALLRCPNCRSKDATEITAEEAAAIRASSSTATQATSNTDMLKKLKELLDSGVITQEEFDAKKKDILAKM